MSAGGFEAKPYTEREQDLIHALLRNLCLLESCCPYRSVTRMAGAAYLLLDAVQDTDEADAGGISVALRILNEQIPDEMLDIVLNPEIEQSGNGISLQALWRHEPEHVALGLLSHMIGAATDVVFAPYSEEARLASEQDASGMALFSDMLSNLIRSQGWTQ